MQTGHSAALLLLCTLKREEAPGRLLGAREKRALSWAKAVLLLWASVSTPVKWVACCSPRNPQQCSRPWCSPSVRLRADGPASAMTQGVQAGLAYATATCLRSLCAWSSVKVHPGSTRYFSKPG